MLRGVKALSAIFVKVIRARALKIPLQARKKMGLKSGTEFEFKQDDDVLVLKPILSKKSKLKSPPLSASEKEEIEESEKEFAAGSSPVYESASELISALRAERDKAQAEKES